MEAGLTARALSPLAGWHFTKVSKLEHGTRPAVARRHPRLVQVLPGGRPGDGSDRCRPQHRRAVYRVAQADAHRDQASPGLPRGRCMNRRRLFRVYETTFIPGLLNTAEYASAILGFWAELMSLPADIETALAARMDRQDVLYAGERRFQFVIEEQTLRTRVGGAQVMSGQLDRLLALVSLPAVSLGIIPGTGRRARPGPRRLLDFRRYAGPAGNRLGGAGHHPARRDRLYTQVFGLLQRSAVYGPGARELIRRAAGELSRE